MLIGLDPLLTPDLLHALATMGHGDSIVLVDANYPAARGRRLIPLPGAGVVAALRAVLTLLPLDTFVPHPAQVMQVVDAPDTVPPAVAAMNEVLRGQAAQPARAVERHEFYRLAEQAYAIVSTGERRFYGNILLIKGVVPPEVQ
jgi:L-fucose mutarotase